MSPSKQSTRGEDARAAQRAALSVTGYLFPDRSFV